MSVRDTVRDTDRGYKALMALLGDLEDVEVLVGIRGNAGNAEDGTPLAVIAAANEFGTARIPERSFLRSTVDSHQGDYEEELGQGLARAVDGGGVQEVDRTLRRMGVRAVADVQTTMRELDTPPNAPSTIERKGTDNPLIDTGQLRQSIDYEVRRS